MEQGCRWGTLAKCRKLFSWRGFQPLDWGEIAFSAPWVLGSASLEFPPWTPASRVNAKSTKVAAVFIFRPLKCSPLPSLACGRQALQPATPGPPLGSTVDKYEYSYGDAYQKMIPPKHKLCPVDHILPQILQRCLENDHFRRVFSCSGTIIFGTICRFVLSFKFDF